MFAIVSYLHVILLGMQEKDTTAQIKFVFAIQITLYHVVAQKFEHRTEWIAEVFTINECVCVMVQKQEILLEECFS